jgi:hypothetical protein
MTKELGRQLLQPEEAVARLHNDYACRDCRGHKSQTDQCRTIVPMSVQAQCKGELHPLNPKISHGFPSLPGLTQPQFPKVWFSGLPQPQLPQVSVFWNSLSQATGLVYSSPYRTSDLFSIWTFLLR